MEIKLYNGNCLDLMNQIEDKSIDMILCDLPYGSTQHNKDVQIPFKPLWEQYERIIKDNGVIALFGQGLFYVDLVNSNRKLFRYDLVWDKVLTSGFLNANRMPLRQHEQIAIFYKKLTKSLKNQNYGYFEATDDSRQGSIEKYPTSILKFQKPHPSIAKHRTEKSIQCLEWLIRTYTNEGDTVLDNCTGAGSCGLACKNTNRNFIGMEIDEQYFNIAVERINV